MYKEKIQDYEADVKLHQRLLQKTNQPHAYMLADIERAEKELDFATRKIKQLEESHKKLRIEHDKLKQVKKNLTDDLQKLTARR